MKKMSISALCGLAAMLLTVILYFTILGDTLLTAIHFICLVAILLAELVTTVYARRAKGNPRGVAAAVTVALMIPVSLILSVVYIVSFPEGYVTYIGLYLAGMVLVNGLARVLLNFDAKKSAENESLQQAKQNMLGLRKLIMTVLADPAAQAYADRLRALEEKLHFSNDAVIAAEDENIRALLLQLRDNIADPEFDCAQKMQEIEKAIDVRNIMNSHN